MSRMIIIEDSKVFLDYASAIVERLGYKVGTAMSLRTAKPIIAKANVADIVLSDFRLPDGNAGELLEWMRSEDISNPVVVMTQYFEASPAVTSLKLGAVDFIDKKAFDTKIRSVLQDITKKLKAMESSSKPIFERKSKAYQYTINEVRLAAKTNMSVLLTGESGTGKEHLALAIHNYSPLADKPFEKVDCGVLTEELAPDELFGHEKGAYTGAETRKDGRFGLASGGTLFLDEVGNLPLRVQQMLLRVLETRTYRPLGGVKDKVAHVRIVAATNEDLYKAVEEGRFREDLFFRLNEYHIQVPPLRDTPEDIMPLAEFFAQETTNGMTARKFDASAINKLLAHCWTGNIRELRNVVRISTGRKTSGTISADDIVFSNFGMKARQTLSLRDSQGERERITQAINMARGNISKAAVILGVSRGTLYNRMKEYGMI